jgi:tRNA(Ile)-lysidine synthase TilS/MesJ
MNALVSITSVEQPQQTLDFGYVVGNDRTVALTVEVDSLLQSNCVVAIGVSGGKDSDACALAVDRHLNSIGHSGPRLLVHSHLGSVEWVDSLSSCRRLADRIGWELMVVQRTHAKKELSSKGNASSSEVA